MNPSPRLLLAIATSMVLGAGCYGDKVLSGTGGASDGGAAHGGAPFDGGGGFGAIGGGGPNPDGGGGGISPPTVCEVSPDGTPCEGPHACESYGCSEGVCKDLGPNEDLFVVRDPTEGDCSAIVCNGGLDPVVGPQPNDVPQADECHVGSCQNDVPSLVAADPGTLCSGGVCDGSQCVECLTAADCTLGQVCLSGMCGNCINDASCEGNARGDSCGGSSCRCHVGSECAQSPAGRRCNGSACGCIQSADCAGADWGSQCTFTTCGCSNANHCVDSSLGEACVSGRCGCNTNADCPPATTCDLLGHVCLL